MLLAIFEQGMEGWGPQVSQWVLGPLLTLQVSLAFMLHANETQVSGV